MNGRELPLVFEAPNPSLTQGGNYNACNIRLSLVVEWYCVVYKICIVKNLDFTTYFNRRQGTLAIKTYADC